MIKNLLVVNDLDLTVDRNDASSKYISVAVLIAYCNDCKVDRICVSRTILRNCKCKLDYSLSVLRCYRRSYRIAELILTGSCVSCDRS